MHLIFTRNHARNHQGSVSIGYPVDALEANVRVLPVVALPQSVGAFRLNTVTAPGTSTTNYGTTFSTCYVYRDTVPLRFMYRTSTQSVL